MGMTVYILLGCFRPTMRSHISGVFADKEEAERTAKEYQALEDRSSPSSDMYYRVEEHPVSPREPADEHPDEHPADTLRNPSSPDENLLLLIGG